MFTSSVVPRTGSWCWKWQNCWMQFLHQPWASQRNMAGLSWPLIFPPTRSILILNFFACQDIIFMSHILSGISWVLQANMTKAFNSSTTVGNMLGLSNTVSLSNIWYHHQINCTFVTGPLLQCCLRQKSVCLQWCLWLLGQPCICLLELPSMYTDVHVFISSQVQWCSSIQYLVHWTLVFSKIMASFAIS